MNGYGVWMVVLSGVRCMEGFLRRFGKCMVKGQ